MSSIKNIFSRLKESIGNISLSKQTKIVILGVFILFIAVGSVAVLVLRPFQLDLQLT